MIELEIEHREKFKPFYMVFVEGKNAPTKKYDDINEANEEAMRLAEKEHTNAYVLKAVGGCGFCYCIADLLPAKA